MSIEAIRPAARPCEPDAIENIVLPMVRQVVNSFAPPGPAAGLEVREKLKRAVEDRLSGPAPLGHYF